MPESVLGAFQRPVLNQDPTIASIPGGATLTLVDQVAPESGVLIAYVNADVALTVTLTSGASSTSGSGSEVILTVNAKRGDVVSLTAQALSGPSFRVQGTVLLTTGFPSFTAIGQLLIGGGPGVAELLDPGTIGYVLTSAGPGATPAWQPASAGSFTAAGQLLVGTGVGAGELLAKGPIGSMLTVGGADPSGLEWGYSVAELQVGAGKLGKYYYEELAIAPGTSWPSIVQSPVMSSAFLLSDYGSCLTGGGTTWTAPVDSVYEFTVVGISQGTAAAAGDLALGVFAGAVTVAQDDRQVPNGAVIQGTLTCRKYIAAGTVVTFSIDQFCSNVHYSAGSGVTVSRVL